MKDAAAFKSSDSCSRGVAMQWRASGLVAALVIGTWFCGSESALAFIKRPDKSYPPGTGPKVGPGGKGNTTTGKGSTIPGKGSTTGPGTFIPAPPPYGSGG